MLAVHVVVGTTRETEAIAYAREHSKEHNDAKARSWYVSGVNILLDGAVPFERQMQ